MSGAISATTLITAGVGVLGAAATVYSAQQNAKSTRYAANAANASAQSSQATSTQPQQAEATVRSNAAAAAGTQSTVLTSSRGLTTPAQTTRRTVLGG